MRIVCLKENLKKYVSIIERFTGKNINLPILNNILIKTENNIITLSATNLEVGVKINFPSKVLKEGSITVPARIFSQVVQSLNGDKINIEEKNLILNIKTEDSLVKINGISSNDFPIIPKIKKISSFFGVNKQDLVEAVNSVLPSVAISEIKPEISGIFFSLSGDTLRVVGTDTFRLSEKKIRLSEKYEPTSFILPKNTAQEIGRLEGDGGEVKINLGENQVEFNFEDLFLISRLVEGKFPEYEGIIPKNFETYFEAGKGELISKIKPSSILSSKLNDITIQVESSIMKMTTINPELGEYVSSLNLESKPNPTTVSFNYRYLLDGLESINDDRIRFQINGESNPTLLRGKEDNTFIYVIMPIKNIRS